MGGLKRKIPDWIKFNIPGGRTYKRVASTIKQQGLHTICIEARCPNIGDCFCSGNATFLILGNICTRNCKYCSVKQGVPSPPDTGEPQRIKNAVYSLGLRYAVITSVTRDDLPDYGAEYFAQCVSLIKAAGSCMVELLVPDFKQRPDSLNMIAESNPDVIGHNIEVTKPFFSMLRPLGSYELSLDLLKRISMSGIPAKTALMVGFGEQISDIESTLQDIYSTGCRMVSIGQYLQSSKNGLPVKYYYHPDEFEEIKKMALETGFKKVYSNPLVRSSYMAEAMLKEEQS